MQKLQLVLQQQLSRCIHLSAYRKMTAASFTTSSRICNDWEKMATTQELQSTVKKDIAREADEREEAMRRIQELKKKISESEQNLTGLQRMKYKQEDQEDLVVKQMRQFKHEQRDLNSLKTGPVKVDTVGDIRNDRYFRSMSSIANLITSGALCFILYGIFRSVTTKQEQKLAEEAAATATAAGANEGKDNEVIDTKDTVPT